MIWDCTGRGFGRVEDPRAPISPRMINSVLERARDEVGLTLHVTAHVAKHSYCTNWIQTWGDSEIEMVKLSRQVGTSVEVLRKTYVHVALDASDWDHIRSFGGD
jgi:integrase